MSRQCPARPRLIRRGSSPSAGAGRNVSGRHHQDGDRGQDARGDLSGALISRTGHGAGVTPSPLVERLDCERGKHGGIVVDSCGAVKGHSGVWALGDCAETPIPGGDSKTYAATAQRRDAREAAGRAQHLGGAPGARRHSPSSLYLAGRTGAGRRARGGGERARRTPIRDARLGAVAERVSRQDAAPEQAHSRRESTGCSTALVWRAASRKNCRLAPSPCPEWSQDPET